MRPDYIQIQWQNGTVPEHGVNGAQMTDVLQVLIDRMEYLQDLSPCEENLQALLHLQGALYYDMLRTVRRKTQGVEGTQRPHQSVDV